MICDGRIAEKVRGKVYKMVVRPVMKYDLDSVSLIRQEAKLKMSLKGTAHDNQFRDKVREASLTQWIYVNIMERGL